MTSRTWTRAEIVALIDERLAKRLDDLRSIGPATDPDAIAHGHALVARLNAEASEKTSEPGGTGAALSSSRADASRPPEAPKDGAGTSSAAECTCPRYLGRITDYFPACPIHGTNRPGQGTVAPVNEVTRTTGPECVCGSYPDGTPAWSPFCKASEHPGRACDKPEPAADAEDEAMRIARWSLYPSQIAAAIRAFGQAERERALREAVDMCEQRKRMFATNKDADEAFVAAGCCAGDIRALLGGGK